MIIFVVIAQFYRIVGGVEIDYFSLNVINYYESFTVILF